MKSLPLAGRLWIAGTLVLVLAGAGTAAGWDVVRIWVPDPRILDTQLGAAVVSGLVAAGVALLVVRLTDKTERRREAEGLAEERLIELYAVVADDQEWNRALQACMAITAADDWQSQPYEFPDLEGIFYPRRDALRRLRLSTRAAARRVDPRGGRVAGLILEYEHAMSRYLAHVYDLSFPGEGVELASDVRRRERDIEDFIEKWLDGRM